ncbi:PREDICTED: pentatricopeptide repeat-containing protein At4g26680, mitochondrial [Fragaria vesca subsp. vesca]|uniref:pentatricopeptide repeat-containing protein At4g26680, mitochondrial n=1 Tax=Fragaria vesca subsp. vesca TaxID=101020 RepID=UPI0002C2E389|nr:PREDICTED: pentatricopeptide repeat-containing protein At4g26680, mitochondrial [Fragaria vesca subsp. vesca]
MNKLPLRQISILPTSIPKEPTFTKPSVYVKLETRNWNPIPIPHRTIPEPKGQDLDFVNVVNSHLIHSDWAKLNSLANGLTAFRVKHVFLKVQKDYVVSLEFFNWVGTHKPTSLTLETHSMILHILTKYRKFKSAESILRKILVPGNIDLPSKLFEAILYSYRSCDSSPRVFDSLFKTFAHMKKFRNATDTFCRMKDYGFYPTVESCNAYVSSLLDLNRADVALAFYREMRRCRISPNVYTLNMVMCAYCRVGKLENAVEVLEKMESMGFSATVVSYNTLIAGHCNKGLLSSAVKFKNLMVKNGLHPSVVTFNTLIDGFCKQGKLPEANIIFSEMKAANVAPNTVTYNTLINGYGQAGNSEMGSRLFEEMSKNRVSADILTYNGLILGLCKEGKTKKAAYLVKELDSKNFVPNASTFSALVGGECVRKNSDRAFLLYKSMVRSGYHPDEHTFKMLLSSFCNNRDFDGAVEILKEMFERNFVPDSDIVSDLCLGLRRCGKGKLVELLCREMESRRLIPQDFDMAKIICCGEENENAEVGNM